jgi:integrase
MPKKAKVLSAAEVRRLTEPGFYAVGGVAGLHLQVTDTGAQSWILRATIGGRRSDMGLGGFPDTTLAQARESAREAREKIRQGIDPLAERRAAQAALRLARAKAITFEEAARATYAVKAAEFKHHRRRNNWIRSLEQYAFPVIGSLPVADIDLSHIQRVLEPIWTTKTHTATKIRERMEAVFTWATVSKHRKGDNPAAWKGNLRAVLPKPSKVSKTTHYPALPWNEVPAFMPKLREREGMGAKALEFIIYTAARSSEVRLATWGEIDLEARLWTVPEERMKAGKPHRVPLCDDAVRLLKALPRFEGSDYVFTAPRGGPLSDMSISAVCRRMGVDAVPHGFRSSFKDWARSCTRYADEVSELALAHVNSDATRAAYARDELLPQRTRLMREWGKFLNTPTTNAAVVPMRAKK